MSCTVNTVQCITSSIIWRGNNTKGACPALYGKTLSRVMSLVKRSLTGLKILKEHTTLLHSYLASRLAKSQMYFIVHYKNVNCMERSIRKWVLWILFYNIKFKSIYLLRNINAIGFLFLTQHTTPLLYVKFHFGVLHMRGTDVSRSDTP